MAKQTATPAKKEESKLGFLLEMIEMVKDYMYLFAFYHRPWASILLIFSITFPMSMTDWDHSMGTKYNRTFAHSMLTYLSIGCDDDLDRMLRAGSLFYITALENIL